MTTILCVEISNIMTTILCVEISNIMYTQRTHAL